MRVGPGAVPAATQHRERDSGQGQAALHRLRLRDLPAITIVAVLAVVAGVGWLYLLRSARVGGIGPGVRGALPLEQLARADAQPLARMAIAWLPVGIATGAALEVLTHSGRVARVAVVALVAALILVISATESDAIANNDSFSMWVGDPLRAAGTWVSLALLVIGAAAGGLAATAVVRAPSAA